MIKWKFYKWDGQMTDLAKEYAEVALDIMEWKRKRNPASYENRLKRLEEGLNFDHIR